MSSWTDECCERVMERRRWQLGNTAVSSDSTAAGVVPHTTTATTTASATTASSSSSKNNNNKDTFVGESLPLTFQFFRQAIKERRERRGVVLQLLAFVPVMLMFLFLFYAERDITGDFYAANALRTYLTQTPLKPVDPSLITPAMSLSTDVDPASRNPYSYWAYFDEAQELPDTYDVLRQLLFPIMFPNESQRSAWYHMTGNGNGSSITVPSGLRVLFDGGVQAVGPARIRTKHVNPGSCKGDSRLYSDNTTAIEYFDRQCFSKSATDDTEQKSAPWSSPVGGGVAGAAPWRFTTEQCGGYSWLYTILYGLIGGYLCGGYVVDVPFETPLDTVLQLANLTSTERFMFGRSMRLFQVEWFGHRGPGDVYVHVNLYTEVTVGGGWNPRAEISPFRVASINGGWIAYAVVVAIGFGVYASMLFVKAAAHYHEHRSVFKSYFLKPWNLVDLANIVAFYVWFGFYCAWYEHSKTLDKGVLGSTIASRDLVSDFPLGLGVAHRLYWTVCYLNALNVLFMFLQVLKLLHLSARVNVLERTLASSASSLLSVVALLALLVLAYSIAGMMLFGSQLYQFRNLSASWSGLFRALIGDFDYDGMTTAVPRGATFVFFWTFIIFGVWVLLNFCIAILMHHFEDEYQKSRPPAMLHALTMFFEAVVWQIRTYGFVSTIKMNIRNSRDLDVLVLLASFYVERRMCEQRTARRQTIRGSLGSSVNGVRVQAVLSQFIPSGLKLPTTDSSCGDVTAKSSLPQHNNNNSLANVVVAPQTATTQSAGVATPLSPSVWSRIKKMLSRFIFDDLLRVRRRQKKGLAKFDHNKVCHLNIRFNNLVEERSRIGALMQTMDPASPNSQMLDWNAVSHIMKVTEVEMALMWCRCCDDYSHTDAALEFRDRQHQHEVIQGSVVTAVATALAPMRRRLMTGGSGGGDVVNGLQRSDVFTMGEELQSRMVSSVTFDVATTANNNNNGSKMSDGSFTPPLRNLGSLIVSNVLQEGGGAKYTCPRLTNGRVAMSVSEVLSDVESKIATMAKTLDLAMK